MVSILVIKWAAPGLQHGLQMQLLTLHQFRVLIMFLLVWIHSAMLAVQLLAGKIMLTGKNNRDQNDIAIKQLIDVYE